MSEEEAQEKQDQETPAKIEDVDSLSDLSELEKIKLELQKEKEKTAKEIAEGEEEEVALTRAQGADECRPAHGRRPQEHG